MEDAADRELREALDEFDMPLKPPVYQWWQPELFASQSIAHHNNVISTSHLPATETVSSMMQRHIDSLADEQTCNGIDMRTGAQPVGPPRGDSARLLAQPLALPYSLSLAHDSIQSTPRALRASAPIRGGGIISSDSQLDSNPHKSILQSNTQIEINFCDSSQDNGTLHAMHLRGGARIDEQIIMRQLVEVGYAHIPNSPELNNQMQLLLGGKPCTYSVLPCNGQSQLQATDDRLQFTPIFQRYPTAMIPVNTGDGLRQMSAGRVLHHDDTAVWCGELARAQLATAQLAGVTDLLKAPLTLAENSILATLPPREPSAKVEFQGGHLDAMPTTLPSSNVLPTGVVMITPIDKNANVRAIPISVVAKLGRLPFRDEFDDLAVVVNITVGSTLLMRIETAHGGGNSLGHRVHGLLLPASSPSDTTQTYTTTYFLKRRPAKKAISVTDVRPMPAQIDTMPVDAHLAGDVIGSLLPDGELEELPPLCESHAPEPPLIAQLSTSPELASGVNTRLESYLRAAAAAAIQEGIGPDGFHIRPIPRAPGNDGAMYALLTGELGVAKMTYQTRAAVTEATLMVFRPIQGVAIRSHTAATRRYIGRIRKLLELIANDHCVTTEHVISMLSST